jgi:hypothetical protein
MSKLTILGTALVTSMVAVVLHGTNTAQSADGARTLRFYEHDTQQASIDLGDPGVSPGDEYIFRATCSTTKAERSSGGSPGSARR